MRHDLHVAAGAVEVGEDEGDVVLRKAGAVAAAGLALAGEDIEQLVVVHHVDELGGLAAQLVIELPAGGEDVVRPAAGLRVAAAEGEGVVRIAHRIGLAEALGLAAEDLVGEGDYVLDDGGAEALHVLLAVAVAAHAVVAERDVVLVPELFAHRVAQLDELVVYRIELIRVLHVPLALGLPGGGAALVVRVLLEAGELAHRVGLALKGDLSAGDELGVLGGERVLALQLGDDLRGEGAQRDLRVQEHQAVVFALEIRAEGRFEQREVPLVGVLLQLGQRPVGELDLLVVELVGGVYVVADVGDGEHGLRVGGAALHLEKYGVRLLEAPGRRQAPGGVIEELFQRLDIRAFIGHL